MPLDLKARVDQLAGERQQYLHFFEQAAEAYLLTDAEGVISDANGAAVDLLHRRRGILRGKPFATVVALDQRGRFRDRLRELRNGAAGPFRTIVVAAETRVEVTLTARLMGSPGAARGICWRLDAPQ